MRAYSLLTVIAAFAFAGCSGRANQQTENAYNIIPAPVSMVAAKGVFRISNDTRVIVSPLNDETRLAASFLTAMVEKGASVSMPVEEGTKPARGNIFMMIDTSINLGAEGYDLEVTKKNVILKAPTAAGLFHGVQTIRQLLPPQIEVAGGITAVKNLTLPACFISDEPRFGYRGLHLDVCRHMFPVEEIKKYIDILALHKINKFHWHLTDDQGWRIEIKKYPNLTVVGSQRKETLVGPGGKKTYTFDGQPYGGFFTQDEVREIVKYAAERFVTVIPEIEMPGHAQAALASYPVLSCTGKPIEVATRWGVFEDVFCAGKDTTFAFLEDVIDEVIELFPSEYIHIGGDECPKVRWQKCPDCQKRMKEEGLKDESELQSYFITRMEKYINSKGRKIIGWDEILEGGLAPEATVMSWRGIKGGIEAAKMGHDVIMTPGTHMYLDHYQSEREGEPLAIGGYSPLEWVYSYEPIPAELTAEEVKYVLGLQANVWAEYIPTSEHLEYMAFPRAFAVAEIGWTPLMKRDFEDFLARFTAMRVRYDLMKINYFKGDYRNTRGRER
ncbi:MAG TPA: beta-N-acetylhexosaminidase [Bacteroidales bacterium]|nr:beta-N-acetylhexosaminidase [Bacteroidales bacterium]